MSSMAQDHIKAKELGRHETQVAAIKQRARHWRLTDCTEATLEQMRHALIGEIELLEAQLARADERFWAYIQAGRPLNTEESREEIERLAAQWESLNGHLQEVDEALLERHLHSRLVQFLGGERRVGWLEAAVFLSIIVVVALTIAELSLPLVGEIVTWIIRIDTAICLFLISDFCVRWYLAEDRSWYFRKYWLDLFSSIPFYEFFFLGHILRYARLLRLIRIIRALRVLFQRYRGLDKLFQTFQMNLLKRSVIIALFLLLFGAFSISWLEGQQTPVSGVAQSVWWSFTTVVTGGFVDLYNPMTLGGRLVTVGLVLLGLTVTGIFTASLTSVLVEDESTRIEQNQHTLESHIGVLNQKLDLLSGETNRGLIALETVAQALSHQTSTEAVAHVLAEAMIRDFECVQASVHLLSENGEEVVRIVQAGLPQVTPPQHVPVGSGLIGRVVAKLLVFTDFTGVDLEPETEVSIGLEGMTMVCPLVAANQVLGVLHVVLPDTLARFYLYNRVPMTLAHHAAMGLLMRRARQSPEPAPLPLTE